MTEQINKVTLDLEHYHKLKAAFDAYEKGLECRVTKFGAIANYSFIEAESGLADIVKENTRLKTETNYLNRRLYDLDSKLSEIKTLKTPTIWQLIKSKFKKS